MRSASTITRPRCGRQATEVMPLDACTVFYECKGCSAVLRPLPGDCCVFCSYGDTPCPPVQEARAAADGASWRPRVEARPPFGRRWSQLFFFRRRTLRATGALYEFESRAADGSGSAATS